MERKDNFVKSRKQTSHASRINFELQKQFGKQQKLRSGKIASYRSHFQKDNYETPSLDKCIEMLAVCVYAFNCIKFTFDYGWF
jgi:hypothetical protein